MDLRPADIRKLLTELLRTDQDIVAFAIDGELTAASRFAVGMDRQQKLNLLLELHEPAELLARLRARDGAATERALAKLGLAVPSAAAPAPTPSPRSQPAVSRRRRASEARQVTIQLTIERTAGRDSPRRLYATYHVPAYRPLAKTAPIELEMLEQSVPWLAYQRQCGHAALSQLLQVGEEAELKKFLTGGQVTGEQGIGQLLYRTLFPDPKVEASVMAYLLDETGPDGAAIPTRQPVEVRIVTTESELIGLPWRLTCWKGNLLADHGWTFAVSPVLPERQAVRLSALSRVLVFAPSVPELEELNGREHVTELRTQLSQGIPEQGSDHWFVEVHTRAELDRALRTTSFDAFYYYGHGCVFDGQVCLRLAAGEQREALLTIADLKRMFGDAPPQLAFVNACFSGAAGWQSAGHLLTPQVPVVVCSLSKAFVFYSSALAIRWWKGVLLERRDPVALLHDRDPADLAQSQRDFEWALPAVFASYTSWEPTPILVTRRDSRNPLRIDRTAARAQVAEQVSALTTGSKRRVEALIAYAHDRSLIERFSWQATDHLERRRVAPVFSLDLQFPHERGALHQRLCDDFTRQVSQPGESLAMALRRHKPRVRNAGIPVLWLNFGVFGDGARNPKLDSTQLEVWLRWSSEFLGHAQHCPDDMRIVSFLSLRVEPSRHEKLREVTEKLKYDLNSERFRMYLLPSLSKVEKGEIKDHLSDPDLSSCSENAKNVVDATELIYLDTQGHYEQVVEHVEWGEKNGWHSLIDKLREKHSLSSEPDKKEDF